MPQIRGRDEEILLSIINDTEYTGIPKSRIEVLLLQLKEVIENSGTKDYTDLENKPSINDVVLVGNKTLSDLGIVNPMMIKGRLDSYSDLANVQNPQPGWVYFIGLSTDITLEEYVYTIDNRWEFLGYNTIVVDSQLSATSENPVQNKVITQAINGKQDAIDSSHKLSSDLVDDSNATNKFTTTADITKLGRIVMDSTESTVLYFQSTQPSSPADGDIWIG